MKLKWCGSIWCGKQTPLLRQKKLYYLVRTRCSTKCQPVLNTNQDNNALMSYFDNNDEIQVNDECTHGCEDEEAQLDGISSSQNQHLMDGLYDFGGETDGRYIREIQQPNAYEMLDELPLPDFIKEMAEASKVVDLNSIRGDYEYALVVHEVEDDHSTHKQPIFAQVDGVDGSYPHDLVIINANRENFPMFQGLIFHAYPLFGQKYSDINADYAENLCLEHPHSQVSIESFITLYRAQLVKFVKNDVWPLLSDDVECFRGSRLSIILDVNVHKRKLSELENDWRSFLNFKEAYSWGKKNINFEELVWNMTFEMMCSCRLVFDPGVLRRFKRNVNVEVSHLRISLSFQNGCNSAIDQELDNWGKLFVHLALGERLMDTIPSPHVHYAYVYCLSSNALARKILTKAHSKNVDIGLQVHLFYLPPVHDSWQPSVPDLSFRVCQTKVFVPSDWFKQELLLSCKPYFTFLTTMALVLTLEDKGDFKREGVYDIIIHSFIATNDNLIWPKKYMEIMSFTVRLSDFLYHMPMEKQCHIRLEKGHLLCNAFLYGKLRGDEIIQVFIWDPGSANMIVLGMLTKSNKNVKSTKYWVISSGELNARADGCLLAIVKQIGFSTPLSVLLENAIEEAAKFTFYQRLSHYVKLLMITFDVRRTTWSNEYGWRYFTLSCDMLMIEQISSLVFDPGGRKNNFYHVENLTSKFVQTTAIFLSCCLACLAHLNLLQSSDCVVHEVAILVFDPGGYGPYGDGQKVMEQPKACQYGDGKQLKDKRSEDHRIYVFDPGGPFGRLVIDDMVAILQSGKYADMPCFNYGLSLILEDKDRFKRRVLISSKI